MNPTPPPLPVAPDFSSAKRDFVELYGSVAVTNTYLKIAVGCLCLVALGLISLNVSTIRLFRDFKPLVVRIDDVGRAQAVAYDGFAYEPREAEIKYFLIRFVEQHYGRMRATLKESYTRSLYFLDRPLAERLMEANKKSGLIEEFLVGQSDEIDIEVKSVTIEDLRKAPYRATVDFEKIYYARSSPHRAQARALRGELRVHLPRARSKRADSHQSARLHDHLLPAGSGVLMIGGPLIATIVLFLALGIYLLGACQFLIPYRALLIEKYGFVILAYSAALFLNVFTLIYFVSRKFFLKDTGRKLAHIEKQLRSGQSISAELSRHLEELR